MKINVTGGEMSPREIDKYIEYVEEKYRGRQIKGIDIFINGDFVDLKTYFKDMDFQRAYRSTDYLVESTDKLNDAKQREFADTTRHNIK